MGVSTDKVMVDTDSIQTVGKLRTVHIMTVYPSPRTNANNVMLDRHVQKTGFDCAARTFIGIQTFGYLNGRQVGSGPETGDWKEKLVPVKNDALSNRVLSLVCSSAAPNLGPGASPKHQSSSGSGIILNPSGDVLSNDHVVRNCKSISIKAADEEPVAAHVDAVDSKNDLAVLKTQGSRAIGVPASFRRQSRPAKLGETIGVLGFPLTGFLSAEPKATFGQINSVAGVNNDYTLLQISAPIQPGNSGGPVLDASGLVIGVVVSQASMAVAAAVGNVPQNVNFAVRGEIAQIFLAARGIKYNIGANQRKLETDEIAARGRKSTVLIVCQGE